MHRGREIQKDDKERKKEKFRVERKGKEVNEKCEREEKMKVRKGEDTIEDWKRKKDDEKYEKERIK